MGTFTNYQYQLSTEVQSIIEVLSEQLYCPLLDTGQRLYTGVLSTPPCDHLTMGVLMGRGGEAGGGQCTLYSQVPGWPGQ